MNTKKKMFWVTGVVLAGLVFLVLRVLFTQPEERQIPINEPVGLTAVRAALEKAEWVRVVVRLRYEQTEVADPEITKQEIQSLQDRVLADMANKNFLLVSRPSYSPFLFGKINKAGLEQLLVHPDIIGVELEKLSAPTMPFAP